MNQHLNDLLQKQVSRKEFLGMSGLAVASIFGFGTLVKLLSGKSSLHKHFTSGFGSGVYGGRND